MAGEGKAFYTEYMSVVDAINAYRQKAGQSALPATYWTSPQVAVGAQMTWSQVEKLDTAITEARTYHKTGCSSNYSGNNASQTCSANNNHCSGDCSYNSGNLSSYYSGMESGEDTGYYGYYNGNYSSYNSTYRNGVETGDYGGN